MRIAPLLVAISLYCGMNAAVLAHTDAVPEDYPSHIPATGCIKPGDTMILQRTLHEYNVMRVQIADVLHAMADSYNLEADVNQGLLGFAEFFEQLGRHMPPPDPDSEEFRNFDFRLGLSLTAVTVYLNTRSEALTRRFQADRDDPGSTLGRYLARLDDSRNAYTTSLERIHKLEKTGSCSRTPMSLSRWND